MIEYKVIERKITIGERKGQTAYAATPKSTSQLVLKTLIKQIVRETSLSEGDVRSAIASMKNIVCDALLEGRSVDLGDLGHLRIMVPSKYMDKETDVTAQSALKTPKIIFTPKKELRDAAKSVETRVDNPKRREMLAALRGETAGNTGSESSDGSTGSGNTGGSGNSGQEDDDMS